MATRKQECVIGVNSKTNTSYWGLLLVGSKGGGRVTNRMIKMITIYYLIGYRDGTL